MCSEDDLKALARAVGLDNSSLATMSRAEKIAVIEERRREALQDLAKSMGLLGIETLTAAQLSAVVEFRALQRVFAQEAVFQAVLGNSTKELERGTCSNDDLRALATAMGVDTTISSSFSKMSSAKKVTLIEQRRSNACIF